MLILSDEEYADADGNLDEGVICLTWKEFSDAALTEFVEKLEEHGIDVIQYENTSDYVLRLVFNKESFRIKMPLWAEHY